nr:hypothetical protein [uncultured Draconibacterium sp.]
MKVTNYPHHALLHDFGQITQPYFKFTDELLRQTGSVFYDLRIRTGK